MRARLTHKGQVYLVEVDLAVLETDDGQIFMVAGQVSEGSLAYGHTEDADFAEVMQTLGLEGTVLSPQRLKVSSDGKLEPV